MQLQDFLVLHHVNLYQLENNKDRGNDCGLYAIAITTALAHTIDPATVIFDQAMMRSHLIKCTEEDCFSSTKLTESDLMQGTQHAKVNVIDLNRLCIRFEAISNSCSFKSILYERGMFFR